MWRRVLMILAILVGVLGTPIPALSVQEPDAADLIDLAAMPALPDELGEPGYQLARGGYLTIRDAEYLIEQGYDLEPDVVAGALDAGSWRQGYTQTLVLLEDRAYRTSAPLLSVETTIMAFAGSEGAELVTAMMSGAPPSDAELLEPAVDGAATYRTVTSQDDRLVTVIRSEALVLEIVSVDAARTPDPADHERMVRLTLDRVETVRGSDSYGLSQRIVRLEDSRLVPLAIETEAPLVHTYYRLIDDVVVPVAGELRPPMPEDIADDADQIVVSRQTAELASQSWLTAGVILFDFDSPARATDFADTEVYSDPLDEFAASTQSDDALSLTGEVRIESISGEASVGGRYSGYRVTVRDDVSVAQLTIRVTGTARLDQQSVELWALAQQRCLVDGACEPILLTGLLATPDPATPVTSEVEDGFYRSQVAAWQVAFDPGVWQVEEALAEGGYDYLYLRSEEMDATFETIVDQQGDPEQCVLNELDRLREVEDRANITIGSDDPDEAPGGLKPGHGWVIYTVEPLEESRAADEYTLRIDCYTVLDGSTSLVVQTRAPRDAWADVSDMGEDLRSQIEIDGFQGNGSGPARGRSLRDPIAGIQLPRRAVMGTGKPWTGIAA